MTFNPSNLLTHIFLGLGHFQSRRRILAVVRKRRKRSLLGEGGVNMVGLPSGYWREDDTMKKGWRREEGRKGGGKEGPWTPVV